MTSTSNKVDHAFTPNQYPARYFPCIPNYQGIGDVNVQRDEIMCAYFPLYIYYGGTTGMAGFNIQGEFNRVRDAIFVMEAIFYLFVTIKENDKLRKKKKNPILVIEGIPSRHCDLSEENEDENINMVAFRLRLSQCGDYVEGETFMQILEHLFHQNTLRLNSSLNLQQKEYELKCQEQAETQKLLNEQSERNGDEDGEEEQQQLPKKSIKLPPVRREPPPREIKHPQAYQLLTWDIWKQATNNHIGLDAPYVSLDQLTLSTNNITYKEVKRNIKDEKIRYSTELMFNIYNSFVTLIADEKKNGNLGALECSDIHQYIIYTVTESLHHEMDKAETLTYPFKGRFAYQIMDLDLQHWKDYKWPWVSKNLSANGNEREKYANRDAREIMNRPEIHPAGIHTFSQMEKYYTPIVLAGFQCFATPERLEEYYTQRAALSNSSIDVEVYSLETFKKKVTDRLIEAKTKAKIEDCFNKEKEQEQEEMIEDIDEKYSSDSSSSPPVLSRDPYFQYRREAQLISICEFRENLWKEHANIPPAVNACVKFMDDYLKTHPNLCHTRTPKNVNLTPGEDFFVTFLLVLETVFHVNTVHISVLCLLLSCWHAFSLTEFHIHTLFSGPSKSNKSMRFKLVALLLIAKTFELWTYVSSKAKTGFSDDLNHNPSADKKYECLIEIFDELPGVYLGNIPNAKQNQAQNVGSSCSELEAMLKSIMVNGFLNLDVCVMTGDGGRKTLTRKINCRSVLIAGSNDPSSSFQAPVQSRFNFVVDQIKRRFDNGDVIGSMQLIAEITGINMKSEWIEYMQLFQARMCLHQLLIYTGVLEPFHTLASDTIYNHMRELGSEYMLTDLYDPRHFDRFKYLSTMIAMVNAHVSFFDLPYSTIRKYRWKMEYIVFLEKYHRTTSRDGTLALGFLRHQFENPIIENVISTIKQLCEKESKKSPLLTEDKNPPVSYQPLMLVKSALDCALREEKNNEILIHLQSQQNYITTLLNNQSQPIQPIERPQLQLGLQAFQERMNRYECKRISTSHIFTPLLQKSQTSSSSSSSSSISSNSHISSSSTSMVYVAQNQLIQYFADYIHGMMNPQPAKRDLINTLETLTTTNILVKSSFTHQTLSVPALTLTCTDLKMPLRCFEYAGGRLRAVLTKILNHRSAIASDYLFGTPNEHIPYIFQYIEVKKDGGNDPYELYIMNPSSREPTLINLCQDPIYGRNKEETSSFQEHRIITLAKDLGLDKYTTGVLNSKIGLSNAEKLMLPSNDPETATKQQRGCFLYLLGTKKINHLQIPYPYNIPLFNDVNEMDTKELEEMYTVAGGVYRLNEKRKKKQNLEHMIYDTNLALLEHQKNKRIRRRITEEKEEEEEEILPKRRKTKKEQEKEDKLAREETYKKFTEHFNEWPLDPLLIQQDQNQEALKTLYDKEQKFGQGFLQLYEREGKNHSWIIAELLSKGNYKSCRADIERVTAEFAMIDIEELEEDEMIPRNSGIVLQGDGTHAWVST